MIHKLKLKNEILKYCNFEIYNAIKKSFNFTEKELLEEFKKNEFLIENLMYETTFYYEIIMNL